MLANILPTTTRSLRVYQPDNSSLPRNLRQFNSGGLKTIVDDFVRASIARSRRLLRSIDELEREIRESIPKPGRESIIFAFHEQSR